MTKKISLVFVLIGVFLIGGWACSPLNNVGSAQSDQKRDVDSAQSDRSILGKKYGVRFTRPQDANPSLVELRLSLKSDDQKKPVKPHAVEVAAFPPSGRCEGCWLPQDFQVQQDSAGEPYYLLNDLNFDEPGLWKIRVRVYDPASNSSGRELVDESVFEITV